MNLLFYAPSNELQNKPRSTMSKAGIKKCRKAGIMEGCIKNLIIRILAILLTAVCFGFVAAVAEEKENVVKEKELEEQSPKGGRPLWEAGVGGFTGYLPDYPAARENTIRGIGAPYVVYRGDILRVGGDENRGAVSGRFVKNDRYEFDVSLSAAFPVDSKNNNARRDMPDLDFLFGIGPQLRIKLINETNRRKLNLNLQARAVFSTDFSSVMGRGYVLNPQLSYSHENLTDWKVKFSTRVGPIFASEKLMNYFYRVQPQFVRPDRPEFDADAGYLGTNVTFGLSKRFNRRFRLFLGTRLGIYSGATNEDSPLFKDELNVGVFSAFTWSFYQSERRAR